MGKYLGRTVITRNSADRPLLDIQSLEASYQGVIRVLHGVSLNVRRGECVALLGANGAGKTTTLKAVSGMLADEGSVTAGEVWVDGENVTSAPAHSMVRNGMMHVLEGRYVFPDLTVLENLRMGAYTRKDRGQIEADMEQVFDYFPRLRERIAVQAGYLSGGEQQMLVIGRALMARPRILLLDEPSMGLAPILVREVFEIIQRIRSEQELTLLLVEQNAVAALRLADRAYLIEAGKIVLEGPAEELKEDPRIKKAYLGG